MPILGILASSTRVAAGDFESIATVTVGSGGSSSVTFSSIPNTYSHLQIRSMARTNRSGSSTDSGWTRLNSDTNTANYTYHELTGTGSSATAYGSGAPEYMSIVMLTGATATASVFGVAITDFLDYANTNKYKTVRNLGGCDINGSGNIVLNSSVWMNTNAITSIEIVPRTGTQFVQYSHFALYGIKSA
jgi:hypothetical protein